MKETQDALELIRMPFSINWQMNRKLFFDSPDNGDVASVSELCSRYVVLLGKEGMLLSSYNVDRLKHRLKNHFQIFLSFFNLQRELLNQKWLLLALFHRVCSSTMPLKTCNSGFDF